MRAKVKVLTIAFITNAIEKNLIILFGTEHTLKNVF